MKKIMRFFVLLSLVLFGLVPTLVFFVWIERNMNLVWLGLWIDWPWVSIPSEVSIRICFNLGLIAAYGAIHSLLAGRVPRALFTIVAGSTAFLFMVSWQPTGIVLYQWIPNQAVASFISFFLYWLFLLIGVWALATVERPTRFIGLQDQLKETAQPTSLWTRGLYSRVRHPLYSLTLAAWFITPLMSLDRLVFALGMSVYLVFGLRREEGRLSELFGTEYALYRERTPMLIPSFKRSHNKR